MTPFERRMVDVEAARLLRVFVLRAARKTAPAAWNRWIALAELVHHKVCVETCSWDDVIRKLEETRPSPPSELQDLPDEQTPAQRPSAAELRDESGSWVGRLVGRLWR